MNKNLHCNISIALTRLRAIVQEKALTRGGIGEVSSWLIIKPAFKDISLSDMVRDWITCISVCPPHQIPPKLVWIPPCVGKLKVNFA